MNTKTIELFIGSNNTTHKVERDKLIQTLAKQHEGFTVRAATIGYWHGVPEESVTVIIADDFSTIMDTLHKLKQVLKQESIAWHEVAPLEFA